MGFGIHGCDAALSLSLGSGDMQSRRSSPPGLRGEVAVKKEARGGPAFVDVDPALPNLQLRLSPSSSRSLSEDDPEVSRGCYFPCKGRIAGCGSGASCGQDVARANHSASSRSCCAGASDRGQEDDHPESSTPRKKLRLTKEQSALLENCFRQNHTLSPKQKQALARRLNLRQRQIEVWFQNRRARTKVKQTEEDCEVLKRCCEKLTQENKRLRKELQALRSSSGGDGNHHPTTSFWSRTPLRATLSICPSCQRPSSDSDKSFVKTALMLGVGSNSHFFPSFAAC